MTIVIDNFPRTKFSHPQFTAKGETRASVPYEDTKTLWFNTGTLCNIECVNCYIESSPINDRLVYLTVSDIAPYFDELREAGETDIEIGFTGGEPFMAPQMCDMIELALVEGHSVLVLTNAMHPMLRPKVLERLKSLILAYGSRLTFRVSLDHYTAKLHDAERGEGSFAKSCEGLKWLNDNGATLAIAGRTMWHEAEDVARAGYGELFDSLELSLDVNNAAELVLFPEMANDTDPPEITTECWSILNKDPSEIMCASQRMVVKRKGAGKTSVLACTLLPYEEEFELGHTLAETRKDVSLNHSYCASFCVLGGGSCSA